MSLFLFSFNSFLLSARWRSDSKCAGGAQGEFAVLGAIQLAKPKLRSFKGIVTYQLFAPLDSPDELLFKSVSLVRPRLIICPFGLLS